MPTIEKTPKLTKAVDKIVQDLMLHIEKVMDDEEEDLLIQNTVCDLTGDAWMDACEEVRTQIAQRLLYCVRDEYGVVL